MIECDCAHHYYDTTREPVASAARGLTHMDPAELSPATCATAC